MYTADIHRALRCARPNAPALLAGSHRCAAAVQDEKAELNLQLETMMKTNVLDEERFQHGAASLPLQVVLMLIVVSFLRLVEITGRL